MRLKIFTTLFLFLVASPPLDVYAQNIQAFNAEDIDYGSWIPGDGNLQNNDFFCVYKDAGNRRWDVVANGDGPGGAFELNDGMGNTLSINRVRVKAVDLTPGVTATNLGGADNSAPADCGGSDNQRLRVRLLQSDMVNVPPGTYTGTLTFTVSPN